MLVALAETSPLVLAGLAHAVRVGKYPRFLISRTIMSSETRAYSWASMRYSCPLMVCAWTR